MGLRVNQKHRFVVPGHGVFVKLEDSTGQRIGGAEYIATLPSGDTVEGKLDDQGTAKIACPSAGVVKIQFPAYDEHDWDELEPVAVEAPASEEPGEWKVPPTPAFPPSPAPIRATLRDSLGDPIVGESYEVVLDGEVVAAGATTEDGRVRTEPLKPGPYELRFLHIAEGDWDEPDTEESTVDPPASASAASWVVPPAPSFPPSPEPIRAFLRDASGDPIVGEPYQILQDDSVVAEGYTNSDGRVRSADLAPGSYSLHFTNVDASDWEEQEASSSDGES